MYGNCQLVKEYKNYNLWEPLFCTLQLHAAISEQNFLNNLEKNGHLFSEIS